MTLFASLSPSTKAEPLLQKGSWLSLPPRSEQWCGSEYKIEAICSVARHRGHNVGCRTSRLPSTSRRRRQRLWPLASETAHRPTIDEHRR